MHLQPTPTSPKSRTNATKDLEHLYRDSATQQIVKPERPTRLSPATLFLSLIIGFVAGIIGELVFNAYLLDNGSPLMQLLGQSQVVQYPVTSRLPSSRQFASDIETTSKALLAIYTARDGTSPADQVYSQDEQKGTALLLTNDGWAVTTNTVFAGGGAFVAVTADRKILAVKQQIADPASSLIFFKIDGANYSIVSLSNSDIGIGEPSYELSAGVRQALVRVRETWVEEQNARPQGAIESSDVPDRVFTLTDVLPASYRGGALTDARGRVIGVLVGEANATATALPTIVLSSALRTILSNGTLSRPSLGVHYIDLAATPGVSSDMRSARNAGALVTGTKDEPAVLPHSPAADAGILDGDVIVRVDTQMLTEQTGLSSVIQTYAPGALVTLQVLRGGGEESIRVTLGEQATK